MQIKADAAQLKIFYFSSLVILALDQVTKFWAVENLQHRPAQVFLNDFFRFEYAENPGAFLGMGNSLSDPTRFWIFVMFVAVLMLGLAVYIHIKKIKTVDTWAYTLTFAGGVGNLIDRIFRHDGHVVDFMNMGIGPLRTGIFNIADMAIMAGLFMLIFNPKKAPQANPATKAS